MLSYIAASLLRILHRLSKVLLFRAFKIALGDLPSKLAVTCWRNCCSTGIAGLAEGNTGFCALLSHGLLRGGASDCNSFASWGRLLPRSGLGWLGWVGGGADSATTWLSHDLLGGGASDWKSSTGSQGRFLSLGSVFWWGADSTRIFRGRPLPRLDWLGCLPGCLRGRPRPLFGSPATLAFLLGSPGCLRGLPLLALGSVSTLSILVSEKDIGFSCGNSLSTWPQKSSSSSSSTLIGYSTTVSGGEGLIAST